MGRCRRSVSEPGAASRQAQVWAGRPRRHSRLPCGGTGNGSIPLPCWKPGSDSSMRPGNGSLAVPLATDGAVMRVCRKMRSFRLCKLGVAGLVSIYSVIDDPACVEPVVARCSFRISTTGPFRPICAFGGAGGSRNRQRTQSTASRSNGAAGPGRSRVSRPDVIQGSPCRHAVLCCRC